MEEPTDPATFAAIAAILVLVARQPASYQLIAPAEWT
jgi:hypothetical protein